MRTRGLAYAVLALLVAVAAFEPALAADNTAGTTPAGMEASKVNIRMRPPAMTNVPLNEPAVIDLGSLAGEGIPANLTEGVVVKAYTRYVKFEGKNIAQMMLAAVEKNGRREDLAPQSFSGQFDLSADAKLDPAKEVQVPGDRAALLAALQRLQEKPKETKKEEVQAVKVDTQPAQSQNSGSDKKNDMASSYSTPQAIVAAKDTTTTKTTTEGCPIRIDVASMRAIQQSRVETTTGSSVAQSDCGDDLSTTFALLPSYAVCPDQVSLEARKATAQYKLYYVDAGGARKDVSDCTPDSEKVFNIVEKFDGCTLDLDYTALKATPRSSLVYVNANGVENEVRGCQASETKAAAAMTLTTGACPLRHDYAASKSYQMGAYVYLMDGVQYQAGSCRDTGVTYNQEKVYKDNAGAYLCQPIVSVSTSTATLQSRIRISVDGNSQFITECTPDSSSLSVVAETSTDPSTWDHDLAAGVSYGMERYYFLDGGVKKYVTDWQRSTATYPHQVEITGWQNNDGQLYAYPLTTVYITPPTGRYNITTSELLPGALQMSYVFSGTTEAPSGLSEYTGCSAMRLTNKVEAWQRPDTTVYNKPIGAGTPTGPVDVCVDTVVDSRQMMTGLHNYISVPGSGQCGNSCTAQSISDSGTVVCNGPGSYYAYNRMAWYATVNKYNRKNVENGTVVTTYCGFANNNWKATYSQEAQYCKLGDTQSTSYTSSQSNGGHPSGTGLPNIGENWNGYNTTGETSSLVDYQRLGSGATLTTCPF
jgi:hypothetical protein